LKKAASWWLLDILDGHLRTFDDQYNNVSRTFRVNRDGTLSYLRSPHPKPTRRTTRITKVLQSYITRANILEVLLDCDQLAEYLDVFQPLRSRQNMKEERRILNILATLYAYGCNCGPTQASQATGVGKQAITYFRRRYMENHKLMEASSALVDAYSQTSLSRLLQEPGIFMTDAMHFPTLKDRLTARHYFRDFSKKNVLLYQHVTADSVCFFTKALLCSVSEAIHMLDGAVLQTSGYDAAININKKTKHPATKAFNELGKILRSSYMIRFGLEMPLRNTVQRHTARREHWNQFGRNIFHGFGGLLREKDQESQEEIFWFLIVIQNAIALWNTLALDYAVIEARKDGIDITDEDLKHALPTMIEHINFVGQFLLDFNRQLPFKKAVAA
jgi:TnpA family transposase